MQVLLGGFRSLEFEGRPRFIQQRRAVKLDSQDVPLVAQLSPARGRSAFSLEQMNVKDRFAAVMMLNCGALS